jgi:hypothetical protein
VTPPKTLRARLERVTKRGARLGTEVFRSGGGTRRVTTGD